MSGTQVHIAALFETVTAAHAAQTALIAAGIDASSILVLDRYRAEKHHGGVWATLKRWLVPEPDAHRYAEGVTRGHPLLVADIDIAQQELAIHTLASAHPLDIDARAADWRAEGWDGVYADSGPPPDEAPGNAGILSGGMMTGDYGSVGAPLTRPVDTNILRGRVRSYDVG